MSGPSCVLRIALLLAGLAIVQPAGADPTLLEPFEGLRYTDDLDGLKDRRSIRALVVYSKTFYFIDRGRERGMAAEGIQLLRDTGGAEPVAGARTGSGAAGPGGRAPGRRRPDGDGQRQPHFADPEIDQLNRALCAFAAYNAGPTRVKQFRRAAARRGLNPNQWFFNVERIASERIGRETVDHVEHLQVLLRLFARRPATAGSRRGNAWRVRR